MLDASFDALQKGLLVSFMDDITISAREWLINNSNPIAIFLYGSRAYGTATKDSDHDFLIVLSDEAYESLPGSPYTYFQRRLSEAVGSDCDTVVNSRSGFIESSKDAPAAGLPKGSHAWQALNRGKLLFPELDIEAFMRTLR